jgi:hypothetical protein
VVAMLQASRNGNELRPVARLPVSHASTGRRYLVFVRAGHESLHRKLILENPDRNWDCCVSWYAPAEPERLAEYYCGNPRSGFGNKFEGFLEFWEQRPQPWRYRYVALLDDDIYLAPGELSNFFRLCDSYQLYLAQPALSWFTHNTLNSLVRNPVCSLRRVSFVEVMAPCFSAAALENLLHTFNWTKSTWGIDWAWACLLQGQESLYVVDAVSMEHTRTGDGRPTLFYRRLRAAGVDPGEDLRRIQQMFPSFTRARTLSDGHLYRSGVPRWLARGLMFLFERLKFIVRVRKRLLRTWRSCRVRLEDLFEDEFDDE